MEQVKRETSENFKDMPLSFVGSFEGSLGGTFGWSLDGSSLGDRLVKSSLDEISLGWSLGGNFEWE